MNLPTIRQLQYFLALVESSSFRVASENCHVTQSTLSAGIAELEMVLGEKLFERGTRSVSLTQLGKDLVPLALSIIEQAKDMTRISGRRRAPLSGALSLGIIPTIAPYVLPRLLPALQQHFPQLDLTLKEDMSARQLDALKGGTVDMVLMAFPYDTPKMEQDILWEESFYLVSPVGKENKKNKVSLDDLQPETLLLLDDGHCLRDHILSACKLTTTAKTRKNLGATSLQTLVQMVEHGYGVTLLPHMAIDEDAPPRGVIIQRFSDPQPTRKIGLCWRKSDPRAEEFRFLGKFIQEKIAN